MQKNQDRVSLLRRLSLVGTPTGSTTPNSTGPRGVSAASSSVLVGTLLTDAQNWPLCLMVQGQVYQHVLALRPLPKNGKE